MTDSISTPTDQNRSVAIPPAFAHLVNSNACPSTGTSIDVQSLVHTHQHELATLQNNVHHLKQRLANLEHCQFQTQETLVQLHKTLAPIRHLPPEILSEIFEQCLDKRRAQTVLSMRTRYMEAPLLLGRVCRTWRAVAYTTPRLWQDVLVSVYDGRYSNELRREALPVLRTWLAHSGGLPLNLHVRCQAKQVLPELVDFFNIIAAHGTRWNKVYFRLQNAPLIHRLAFRAFSKCTSLSTFDLVDGGQNMSFSGSQQTDEEAEPTHLDLSLAPLRHLSLSLSGLTIQDVQAPWASLTRLFFMQDVLSSTTSITNYVAVLRQCISLKECCITIDSGFRDTPLEPLTLPSLEYLQLQVLREGALTTQLGDFLRILDAQQLHTLVIKDSCPRREVVLYYTQLKSFLQAHTKSLRHLRYATNSKSFTSDDLIGWIAETPSLIELEYHPDEESSPKSLLEALTPRVQAEDDALECLLPCLERLFVYWDTTETVSMVGDMIEKRYALAERGITPFKQISCKPVSVSIGYNCMPPRLLVENLATRLEPLRLKCGLQVDWEACRYDEEHLYC